MTIDLITFCQVKVYIQCRRPNFASYPQPAPGLKDDWKAVSSLENLPGFHADFFRTFSFEDRWFQIIFIPIIVITTIFSLVCWLFVLIGQGVS